MGTIFRSAALSLVLALSAGGALAATPDLPSCDSWSPAATCNYTNASRPGSNSISYVVIHKVQGTASGAVAWYQNCASGVTAHYTYNNTTGYCYQSVREADIAWHSGYWATNQNSIGIEHGGYVTNNDTATVCYDASADETKSAIIYYSVTHDRSHVIGHYQVPGCPGGSGGGSGCHTDPGPNWNWTYYMSKCDPGSASSASDIGIVGDWDNNGTYTPGVLRGQHWFLRNSNTNGPSNIDFYYGTNGDVPVAGDWDGNGSVTPGVFRDGHWYLRNSNSSGVDDLDFVFGAPNDIPIAGDWNGDGIDSIGVVRGTTWYLKNTNSAGAHDITFGYGAAGDKPVTGDWDNNGTFTPGIVRGNIWHLRNLNSSGSASIAAFSFGQASDRFLAGDWNGDGTFTIGVKRGNLWYLRNSNSAGAHDITFGYGQ